MGEPRWFEQHRMEWISETLRVFGFINREHLMKKFGLSMPQASHDLTTFQRRKLGGGAVDKKGNAWVEVDLLPAVLRQIIDAEKRIVANDTKAAPPSDLPQSLRDRVVEVLRPFVALVADYEEHDRAKDDAIMAGRITRRPGEETPPRITFADLRAAASLLLELKERGE